MRGCEHGIEAVGRRRDKRTETPMTANAAERVRRLAVAGLTTGPYPEELWCRAKIRKG